MPSPTRPQPQSLERCLELREQCREAIFSKMDELHSKQMRAIGEIKETLAFSEGRESVSQDQPSRWSRLLPKLIIAWGPFVLFLLVLGLVTWFKSKGWM